MTDQEVAQIKVALFAHIVGTMTDLSLEQAADAVNMVFGKLCIPQAPSA